MPALSAARLVLALAALAVLPHDAQAFDDNRTPDLEKAMRSVVSVLPAWAGRPPSAEEPEGTGVVVADGRLVLTADHILGNPIGVRIRTIEGDIRAARILARDSATDLSLLAVDTPLPALRFGGEVAIGDPVCALGNAFGLGVSATCGRVSAINRSGTGFNTIEDFIQTDAAVNPGMSGGALIDRDGNLVGVLSAIFTKRSDANIGVNFAVSARLTQTALARLRSRTDTSWPALDARLRPHPPRGATGRLGAAVVDIAPGSVAARAGLKAADVIIEAGGRRVRGPDDVVAAFALAAGKARLALSVLRSAETVTIMVPIGQ
jgi:S1-C subfamily serine protease